MPSIINLAQPISDRTDPRLVPNTRGGGAALNGMEQVISPLSSIWKWRIVLPINTVGRARAWRAINAQLDGRFNYLRARVCDRYRIGRRDVEAWSALDPVPYGDGAYHSDGTGFALAQPIASVRSSAARGATTISLEASSLAGSMTAGVFFSVNDWLYVVTDWEEIDDTIAVTFKPPLRAAVEAGEEADFDAKSIWTLDSDDTGAMALRLGRFGEVELNLTEALGRAL